MVPVTGNAIHYKSNEQHNNGYVNHLDSRPGYLDMKNLSQSVQSENYVVPNGNGGDYVSPHFDDSVLKSDEDYMEPLGREYATIYY